MKSNLITMILLTFAINSFSLTFSKNYIVTGSNHQANSDTLIIYNNSDKIITIDTIFEEVEINGKKSNQFAEISFNIVANDNFYYYLFFHNINDSVFSVNLEQNHKQLSIKAHDSISLCNFIFGRCVWCVNTTSSSINSRDTFDIKLRFKYLNTMTDSILFHGPGSFFYDAVLPLRNSSIGNINHPNTYFDLSGRMYKNAAIKNKLKIKSCSQKPNEILIDINQ